MTALTTIRNIGPAQEKALKAVGITTAETLQALGADAAYTKLLQSGTRPHFVMFYVLHMALQGRPWNDCKGDEKQNLRVRFDEIKASAFDADRSELDEFLNRIGVVNPK